MTGIGTHFTATDWRGIAAQGGEVRLRDGQAGPELYNSRHTIGGKIAGFFRDFVATAGRAEKREAAFKELEAFLGPISKNAFQSAGIVKGQALKGSQVARALDFVQSKSLNSLVADPKALIHNTKIRDLEQQLARATPGSSKATGLQGEIDQLKKFTVQSHVDRVTDTYTKQFAGKHDASTQKAMKLAFTMKTLSHKIATGDLNNGRARTALSEQLFRAHGPELAKTHGKQEIQLARLLSGNDVLMSVATGKLKKEDAVLQVRIMAEKAGVSPNDMLKLMRAAFDAEIGSFDPAELQAAGLEKDSQSQGNFSFKEIPLAGDLLPGTYDRIVKDPSDRFGADGLKLADATQNAFDALATAVDQWGDATGLQSIEDLVLAKDDGTHELTRGPGPKSAPVPDESAPPKLSKKEQGAFDKTMEAIRGFDRTTLAKPEREVALPGTRGLTERQHALLKDVHQREAGYVTPEGTKVPPLRDIPDATGVSPKNQVLDLFKTRYGLDQAQAQKLLAKTEQWFQSAPLTITFFGNDNFGKGPTPAFGTGYIAAQEIGTKELGGEQLSELVGGKGSEDGLNAPSVTGEAARGTNYLRWRVEKDAEETGHRGLTRTEQARFGGVNINFEKTKGFEGDSSSYGESHLVLKQDVRDRALFNFNKTRELRGEATMIMYDMLHDKNSFDPTQPKTGYIDAMVHNALGLPGLAFTKLLQLEVEIFGEVDMLKDVAEVRMPQTGFNPAVPHGKELSDEARQNLNSFFTGNGITVDTWSKPPKPSETLMGPALYQAIGEGAKKL